MKKKKKSSHCLLTWVDQLTPRHKDNIEPNNVEMVLGVGLALFVNFTLVSQQ